MRFFLSLAFSTLFVSLVFCQNIVYVNQNATGGLNDGTSWSNAYLNLQTAINGSIAGSEIWVAEGIYFPSADINDNTNPTDNRSKTFKLKAGVSVFGGFKGTETTKLTSPQTNHTILSGDIGIYGNDSDNAYHVMYNNMINTGDIVFQGFIIEYGNGVSSSAGSSGGGLYDRRSTITYSDIIIRFNKANGGGGAISTISDSKFIFCTFVNNYSANNGGGLITSYSRNIFINCKFDNNSSESAGGGTFSLDSFFEMVSCSFKGNQSKTNGGGIYIGSSALNWPWPPIKMHDVVFENNSAPNNGAGIYAQARPAYLSNITCRYNTGSFAISIAGYFYLSNVLMHSNANGGLVARSNSFGTEVKIYNSTLQQNINTNGAAFASSSPFGTCNTEIYNTIIDGKIELDSQTVVSYNHCLIPNAKPNGVWLQMLGTDAGGNVDGVPLYFSKANKDYRLWKCSPGIDEGDSTLLASDWADQDFDLDTLEILLEDLSGYERITGNQVDIGAYEYTPKALNSIKGSSLISNVSKADSLFWVNCQTGQIVSRDSVYFPTSDTTVSYALVVMKGNCIDTSACGVFSPNISILERETKPQFELYPNPSTDFLYLELKRPDAFNTAQFITLSGQIIEQQTLPNQQKLKIEVGHLPAGIYIFQLLSNYATSESRVIVIE